MSLSSALTIALSGIQTASTRLEQTASNISNASTEGYSTKTVNTSSSSLGSIGGGTQVVGFDRAENSALFTTLTKATSNLGLRDTQDEYQQLVQDILGTSSSDSPAISEALSDFTNSWKTYAATPESTVNSTQVIQDAVTLTDEIKRLAGEVEDLDRACYNQIESTVSTLNDTLAQIADLNSKISQATNAGLPTGNLEDERDLLVLDVAEITSITVLERSSGQIAIYSSSGYQMVDGSISKEFTYDGTDITSTNNASLSLNTTLGGGSLEALTDFRATTSPVSTDGSTSVIQKLRDQLDEVTDLFLTTVTTATSGETTFADAYDSATTDTGELASSFFTGTNRTNISVNASLLDGSATLKQASATAVTSALTDSTRTITADGITSTNVSYTSFVSASITSFQQAANNASSLATTAESSHSYLYEQLLNETAVNTDNELVKLTEYQNAYNASAHVMSVVQEMFDVLEALL